jgi:hypothetical protein
VSNRRFTAEEGYSLMFSAAVIEKHRLKFRNLFGLWFWMLGSPR